MPSYEPADLSASCNAGVEVLAWLERPFAEALRALDERGRR
jgi:hypothetical protein